MKSWRVMKDIHGQIFLQYKGVFGWNDYKQDNGCDGDILMQRHYFKTVEEAEAYARYCMKVNDNTVTVIKYVQ